MAGWVKMPLGTEVDLRRGHIVLDEFPALHERCTACPSFSPTSIVAMVAHSATAELLYIILARPVLRMNFPVMLIAEDISVDCG